MLDCFTGRGRRVIDLGGEEARRLRHTGFGAEHLLLGLLREEGAAAVMLASLGVTLERARAQTVELIGVGEEGSPADLPFIPSAKATLERALREALMGSREISPEHILLAIARAEENVAIRVLTELGASPGVVAAGALELLGVLPPSEPPPRRAVAHGLPREPWTETVTSTFRLDPSAERVLILSEEEARGLGCNYISTEHLLLGLLRVREGLAAKALEAAQVTPEAVRTNESVVRVSSRRRLRPEGTPLPLVSTARRALARAGKFAETSSIETEHVLLGLIAVNDSIGPRALIELGVYPQGLREVLEATAEVGDPPPNAAEIARTPPQLAQEDHVTWGFHEALNLARHEAVMRGATHVSADDLLVGLLQVEREGYPGHGIRDSLFAGAWPLLGRLLREVQDRLDRPLDAGDLVVVLGSVPGGIVAEALAALSVDIDALARGVAEARRRGARSELFLSFELFDQLERFQAAIELAAESADHEPLPPIRAQMRELLAAADEHLNHRLEALLEEIRARLELTAD